MARRIAIIVPGGVAQPDSPFAIPVLTDLLERIGPKHDITVYSLARVGDHPSEFMLGSVRVKTIAANHHTRLPVKMLLFFQKFMLDHLKKRYEIVHGIWAVPGGWMATKVQSLLGIPAVVTLQGGEAACVPEIQYGNMCNPRLREKTLQACRQAAALTGVSNYQFQQLAQHGFERNDTQVIPYGTDPERFEPVDKNLSPPFRFLHVGNLTEVKDQRTLLRAFKRIQDQFPDAVLRHVGPDYLDGEVQQYAADLGLGPAVEFLEPQPNSELQTHYNWAHLLLHSSLYEGMPVTLVEAAAAGTPICGTRVGLLSDLEGEFVVAVDPTDDEALAIQVVSLIGDPMRYKKMCQAARRWAVKYSADWTAERYLEIYDKVGSKRR